MERNRKELFKAVSLQMTKQSLNQSKEGEYPSNEVWNSLLSGKLYRRAAFLFVKTAKG